MKKLVRVLGLLVGAAALIGGAVWITMTLEARGFSHKTALYGSLPFMFAGAIALVWLIQKLDDKVLGSSNERTQIPFGPWDVALPPKEKEKWKMDLERFKAQRIAEIRNDPRRARFVAEFEKNRFLTDEQMEYILDPAALVTCPHLRPLEKFLKDGGVEMLAFPQANSVSASISYRDIRFPIEDPIYYHTQDDERGRDFSMRCRHCRSAIYLLS